MPYSHCPHCKNPVTHVVLEAIPVNAIGATWTGVTYACPACNCVLSVGIDPVAMKSDAVNEILDGLRKD